MPCIPNPGEAGKVLYNTIPNPGARLFPLDKGSNNGVDAGVLKLPLTCLKTRRYILMGCS